MTIEKDEAAIPRTVVAVLTRGGAAHTLPLASSPPPSPPAASPPTQNDPSQPSAISSVLPSIDPGETWQGAAIKKTPSDRALRVRWECVSTLVKKGG